MFFSEEKNQKTFIPDAGSNVSDYAAKRRRRHA
jgi:hypothetical protein